MEYIVFGQPVIAEEEIQNVVDVLKSRWLGTGPRVAEFQRLFAVYKNTKHAIALNSCTAALHLSLLAIGIKPRRAGRLVFMMGTALSSARNHRNRCE